MSTHVAAVKAIVQRDPQGRCVMSWPAGYEYDFWTDEAAAHRAADVTTRLLQTAETVDRQWIDESLKRRGLLVRARGKRTAES